MTSAAMLKEKEGLPHSGDRPGNIIAVEKSVIK